jgi:hypothetical protein
METGRVDAFLPSVGGFHFDNQFPPGSTYPVITLPVIGTIASQDATRGLCGGFVFAALDLFENSPKLAPPSASSAPADGSVLFDYLVNRFLASLGSQSAWANALKIITWIQTPSHNVIIPVQGPGLAYRMVEQEWPVIKADIDAGLPSPLYLVMAPQCGVDDIPGIIDALGNSHQVLAYAYQLDNSDNLTLWVYDPNDAGNDDSTITLNISNPANTITITAPDIEARLGDAAAIRGIFRAEYAWASPAALGTSPYPQAFAATERSWTGNFTGPGQSELLYYWPGGEQWWLAQYKGGQLGMTLAGSTAGFGNTAADPTWIADFTGAGRSQILFYSAGDQNWWLGTITNGQLGWSLAGNTKGFGNTAADPTWIADFTGAGRSQILFYSPIDTHWWLGQFTAAELQFGLVAKVAE